MNDSSPKKSENGHASSRQPQLKYFRMKKTITVLCMLGFIFSINAQDLQTIKLKTPNKTGGTSVLEAFSKRQSVREYSDKQLSEQDLSNLIWATIGINRTESGKRTAPTAMNKQEIDLYVFFPEGVYLYNAKEHSLVPVVKGDFYSLIAVKQDFVHKAPVILLLVADISKFDGDNNEQKMLFGALDAGIASQNISIFCAGTNMATVPRAWMDNDAIKKALNLKDTQYPMLNHPVGHSK